MVFCVRFKTFTLILLFKTAESEVFDTENATNLFQFYKFKYNKRYRNPELEENAFKNFVNNLNKVNSLNEEHIGPETMYVVNKYADKDDNKIEQHYGITLKPYYNVRDPAVFNKKDDTNFFEDIKLYDLDDAEHVYDAFLKKFKKQKATDSLDNTIRYYRFVKTLAELNNHNFKSKDRQKLDAKADELREPIVYAG